MRLIIDLYVDGLKRISYFFVVVHSGVYFMTVDAILVFISITGKLQAGDPYESGVSQGLDHNYNYCFCGLRNKPQKQ